VHISNHGSDVSARESLSTCAGSFTPPGDNVSERLVPLVEVSFVHGVNVAVLRDLNVRLGKNEFSDGLVEGEDVDTVSKSEGKESRGRVQAVSGGNKVGSGLEGVGKALGFLLGAFVTNAFGINIAVFTVFVDSNDGSGRDSGVNIGGTIKRVKDSDVSLSLFDDDFLGVGSGASDQIDRDIFLFGSQDTKASGESKGSLQKIVGDNIKFLLVLSLDIDLTLVSQGFTGRKLGSLDQVGHGLAGGIDGTKEGGQLAKLGVEHSNLVHEAREGDSGGVANFIEDRSLRLGTGHGRGVDGGMESAEGTVSSRSRGEGIGGRGRDKQGKEREFHS